MNEGKRLLKNMADKQEMIYCFYKFPYSHI